MQRPRFLSPFLFFAWLLMTPYAQVFFVHGNAWGENPKEERIILSLPEMIDMAIAKSPEIGELRCAIGAARSDLDQIRPPIIGRCRLWVPPAPSRIPSFRGVKILRDAPAEGREGLLLAFALSFLVVEFLFIYSVCISNDYFFKTI